MASSTDFSDTGDSTSVASMTNNTTPPHHRTQSVRSHSFQRCDSGYCSDISTGSTSKSRNRRKTMHKETNTTSPPEKQSLDKTTTAPYRSSRTRNSSTSSHPYTAQAFPHPIRWQGSHSQVPRNGCEPLNASGWDSGSRNSSTAPTTHHRSTPSSRRSSFLVRPPTEAYPTSIPRHNRAISTSNYLLYENPFLPPPTYNPQPRSPSPIASRTISFPGPTNERPQPDSPSSPSSTSAAAEEGPQPRYTNFVPATTIDWTLPLTPGHEHEKLASSSRGIRTLWRKLIPRRFSNSEGYDEADGGCIRRYYRPRSSSTDKHKEEEESSIELLLEDKNQEKIHGWACFGIKKGD